MTNLDRLCSEIKREEDALLVAGHRRALVRQRLSAANAPHLQRTAPFSIPAALALAATCIVAAATCVFLWHSHQPSLVTATVGESMTPVSAGAWVHASESSSLPLRFSDGSRVDVAPRSRMRLMDLGTRGAQLALESGRAGIAVAHGENRKWELHAGPFVVRVTGTRFDISWSPNEDWFELVLEEGQVELAGCGFGTGRRLVAGQTVHASCRENRVEIAYTRDTTASAARASPGQPADVAAAGDAPGEVASHAATRVTKGDSHGAAAPSASNSDPAKSNWIALAQQGKYSDAIAAVERLGFAAQCARSQVAELALLGDTARHARNFNRARQAFVLLRQRFAGSSQAGVAAFSLGVIEFDQFQAYAKAAQWFRTYVKENPGGPLIREARGRLMEALDRSGSSEARALASDYLRDYPAGPHAELAQRIVQAP